MLYLDKLEFGSLNQHFHTKCKCVQAQTTKTILQFANCFSSPQGGAAAVSLTFAPR